MTSGNWGRLRPSDLPWQAIHHEGNVAGRARLLGGGDAPSVLDLALHPGASVELPASPEASLSIVTAGALTVHEERRYRAGHLRWASPGSPGLLVHAGPEGADLTQVSLGTSRPSVMASPSGVRPPGLLDEAGTTRVRSVHIDDVEFLQFPDAAGRDTQPVQLLFTGEPYVLRTRFAPDFIAGEHWHEFDTIYVLTAGSMRFGPQEPVYETGDIRWVKGGHAYGPEHPGPQGVEFYLISLGGPVSLHWADLEPAPRGRLSGR